MKKIMETTKRQRRSIALLLWLLLLSLSSRSCCVGFVVSPIPQRSRTLLRPSKLLASDEKKTAVPSTETNVPIVPSNNNDNNQSSSKSSSSWTKQSLQIALPALVGMLVDPLLSLMDTAYVGRLGSKHDLAALGACTSIFHLAFNGFRATTQATTSLVASNAHDDKTHVVSTSLGFGLAIGGTVSLVLYLCGTWALTRMGIPLSSPLMEPAQSYLYTRLWAAPAVLFIGVSEGAFRGYGNAMIPLYASLTAAFLNLVLDPLFMCGMGRWGVRGAAAATALSQLGAAATYGYHLVKKHMLPKPNQKSTVSKANIIRSILGANLAMFLKQGSLLLGWLYATACATKLGTNHVAAHQVGLSLWLIFALMLDGAAVSSQVLYGQSTSDSERGSLVRYMLQLGLFQGVVSMAIVKVLGLWLPYIFTNDPIVQGHLVQLMPVLAWQQVLVSLTLVSEGLAVGANRFRTLALGTALSSLLCVTQMARVTSIVGIWSWGITSLFAGRLATALVAVFWRGPHKGTPNAQQQQQQGSDIVGHVLPQTK